MEARNSSDRRRTRMLASACAAAAAAALTGFAAQRACAGLMVNVLALPGSGYSVDPSGKSVTAPFGTTVTLGVYARVSGTNATQQIGDFDGEADAADTHNDDTLDIISGSFRSVGALLADLNPAPGPLTYNSRVAPFTANGSQNGIASDFDSDGDLDIGTITDPSATNVWYLRSGAMTSAIRLDGTTNGWVSENLLPGGGIIGFGANSEDTILDPTDAVLRVGTLRAIVTGGSGSTALNYYPRPAGATDFSALWWEDGIATGKMPSTGAFTIGAPVIITGVPEPTAIAVLGIASLGLLARRKR
jgi:hypothetical protein